MAGIRERLRRRIRARRADLPRGDLREVDAADRARQEAEREARQQAREEYLEQVKENRREQYREQAAASLRNRLGDASAVAERGADAVASGGTRSIRAALKAAAAGAGGMATEQPRQRRPRGDDTQEMVARAERAGTAPPIADASLDPGASPGTMDMLVRGPAGGGPRVDDLVYGGPAPARDEPTMEAFVTGGSEPRVDDLVTGGGESDTTDAPSDPLAFDYEL
jgi:hypothetical protein